MKKSAMAPPASSAIVPPNAKNRHRISALAGRSYGDSGARSDARQNREAVTERLMEDDEKATGQTGKNAGSAAE